MAGSARHRPPVGRWSAVVRPRQRGSHLQLWVCWATGEMDARQSSAVPGSLLVFTASDGLETAWGLYRPGPGLGLASPKMIGPHRRRVPQPPVASQVCSRQAGPGYLARPAQ